MNFQKIVLYIAIILLIIALIVFGSMLYIDKNVSFADLSKAHPQIL